MTNDEKEIRQVVSTWLSATKAGDLETVLGLMAEDAVFLVPGHAPMIGRAAYAEASRALAANGPPTFDGRSEIQELRVLGDWAYLWSRLTVLTIPAGGGKPAVRAGHTLTIFRKQGGKWLLSRDANLLVPVPD